MRTVIHWPTVLAAVLASAGLLMVFAATLLLFVFPNYSLQLDLSQQELAVNLPASLPVQVHLAEPIDARIDGALQTRVPIKQKLPMRIDDRLQLDVQMDAMVPMNFDVIINDRVKVDTEIQTSVFGIPMTLPIKGELPLSMVVPINQQVPIRFNAPLTADLRESFEIHLDAEIKTAIEVQESFSIPVLEPLDTEIRLRADTPVNVQVGSDAVSMPLKSMRLKRSKQDASTTPRFSASRD